MALNSRSITYDALLTTTADKIHKSGAVQDAISNSNPTFKALFEGNKIKKIDVGGDQIRSAIMYEHNLPKSYSDYEQIDISPKDGITSMWLPWAQYAGAISISGIQKFKNMGKEKIADLLKEKVTQLTAGYSEKMDQDLWDLTGRQATHPYSGNAGKNLIGLPIWIQDATDLAADVYDVGHIDQSVETWWKNQALDGDGATTTVLLKNTMSKMFNNCSQGPGGTPDLVIANQAGFELYERSLQDQIRYMSIKDASSGFEQLHFKTAKMFWDGYVPDLEAGVTGALNGGAVDNNTMFFLNTKTFTLYMGRDHDFKPRGFQTPIDQDASTSLYLAYAQLVCDNRRKNGVIFDIPLTVTG
jgi:hypothetical protein